MLFSAQANLAFRSVPKKRHIWHVIALFLVVAALAGVLTWILTRPEVQKAAPPVTPVTSAPGEGTPSPGAPGTPGATPVPGGGDDRTRFEKWWDSRKTYQKVLFVVLVTLGSLLVVVGIAFGLRSISSPRPDYTSIRLAAKEYVADNEVFDGNQKLVPADLSNLSVEQFEAIANRTGDAKLQSYADKAKLEARKFNEFTELIGLKGVDGFRDLPKTLTKKTIDFYNEGLDKANRGLKQLTALEGFHGPAGNTREVVLAYKDPKKEEARVSSTEESV